MSNERRKRWADAVVATSIAVVVAACQSIPTGTASQSVAATGIVSPARSSAPTQSAPTATAIPAIDGVPTSVNGTPVIMGDALRAEVKARTDSTPFLAGGWFRAGEPDGRYCAIDFLPEGMNLCIFGFELFDARTGPWAISIAPGGRAPAVIDRALPYAADRPVVLKIHVRDSTCAQVSGPVAMSCALVPVVDGVIWLGPVQLQPAIPTARPSEPSDGMSRSAAIALAIRNIGTIPGRRLVLICAELRKSSEVSDAGAIDTDPWLWVVVMERGTEDWNLVGMQYRTGKLLVGEFHVAPIWC